MATKHYLDISTGAIGARGAIPEQRRLELKADEYQRLIVDDDARRRIIWFEAHRAQLALEGRLPGQEG